DDGEQDVYEKRADAAARRGQLGAGRQRRQALHVVSGRRGAVTGSRRGGTPRRRGAPPAGGGGRPGNAPLRRGGGGPPGRGGGGRGREGSVRRGWAERAGRWGRRIGRGLLPRGLPRVRWIVWLAHVTSCRWIGRRSFQVGGEYAISALWRAVSPTDEWCQRG